MSFLHLEHFEAYFTILESLSHVKSENPVFRNSKTGFLRAYTNIRFSNFYVGIAHDLKILKW